MFSIVICRKSGDKWQSKTVSNGFFFIFVRRYINVYDCRLLGVFQLNEFNLSLQLLLVDLSLHVHVWLIFTPNSTLEFLSGLTDYIYPNSSYLIHTFLRFQQYKDGGKILNYRAKIDLVQGWLMKLGTLSILCGFSRIRQFWKDFSFCIFPFTIVCYLDFVHNMHVTLTLCILMDFPFILIQ